MAQVSQQRAIDTIERLGVKITHTFGTSNGLNTTNMEGGAISITGAP